MENQKEIKKEVRKEGPGAVWAEESLQQTRPYKYPWLEVECGELGMQFVVLLIFQPSDVMAGSNK